MPPLRLYLDENVDRRVADGLRRRGVEALTAVEEGTLGSSDQRQLAHAAARGAALVTHDHHFLALAAAMARGGQSHAGIIFIELRRLGIGECIRRLALCVDLLDAESMRDRVEFL